MSTRTRRFITGALALTVVAALVALAAVIFMIPVGKDHQDQAAPPAAGTVGAALRKVMPANPVMALTTPPSPDWWAYLARLNPNLRLDQVTITGAPVRPLGYGYAQIITKTDDIASALPLHAVVYLQTGTVEDADDLVAWLTEQPGHEYRRAYRTGTTTLVAPEWADGTEYHLDLTSPTDALRDKVGTPDTRAVWTWDLGLWNTTLRNRAGTDQSRDLTGATLSALGITDKTVLTVTATKPGTFTGQATGHATNKVNLGAVSAALAATDTVLYSRTRSDDTTSTTMSAISTNLSRVLKDGGFTVWRPEAKPSTIGNPPGDNLLPASKTQSVSATFDPRAITDYATGKETNQQASTALTFQVDADGNAAVRIP